MQGLNPNTLFSIFEKGDEAIYKEHKIDGVLDNPFVLLGMVLRGLDNFMLMDVIYTRNYPKEYKPQRHMVKKKYFFNLFNYLQRIDWGTVGTSYKAGTSFEFDETIHRLNHFLKYFENIEEYEKCAVIRDSIIKIKVIKTSVKVQ